MKQDFFLPLFMQQANLLSIAEAERVCGAIILGLAGVLSESHFNSFLKIVPISKSQRPNARFYHRVPNKKVQFSLDVLLSRISTLLGLSSNEEAAQYVLGFFAANTILIHESQRRRLAVILPPELYNFIS